MIPHFLLQKQKVYRLLKRHYTKKFVSLAQRSDSETKAHAIHSDLQQVLSYIRWVMQPLLSPNYVIIPVSVCVCVCGGGDLLHMMGNAAAAVPNYVIIPVSVCVVGGGGGSATYDGSCSRCCPQLCYHTCNFV